MRDQVLHACFVSLIASAGSDSRHPDAILFNGVVCSIGDWLENWKITPAMANRTQDQSRSSEGSELGTSGGTMTDLTVTNGLVGKGELSKVVSTHVSSDFDGRPVLSTVNFDNGSDHIGSDDHVSQVSLNTLGLFSHGGGLDSSFALLDESGVRASTVTLERSSVLGGEEVNDLFLVHLEEFIELDTSVDLLLEGLSLDGGGSLGHIY
jgi:hypothetical protein